MKVLASAEVVSNMAARNRKLFKKIPSSGTANKKLVATGKKLFLDNYSFGFFGCTSEVNNLCVWKLACKISYSLLHRGSQESI